MALQCCGFAKSSFAKEEQSCAMVLQGPATNSKARQTEGTEMSCKEAPRKCLETLSCGNAKPRDAEDMRCTVLFCLGIAIEKLCIAKERLRKSLA